MLIKEIKKLPEYCACKGSKVEVNHKGHLTKNKETADVKYMRNNFS